MKTPAFDNSLNPCSVTPIENGFALTANSRTDFICKYQAYVRDEAAFYYTELSGDFTFSARVETIGNGNYDASFLMIRESKDLWIKLAVELGVDGTLSGDSVKNFRDGS